MAGEISAEHMQTAISVGIIILGYVWIEKRLKSIVSDAFTQHNETEALRYGILEEKIIVLQKDVDKLFKHMPKRSSDVPTEQE